MQLMMRNVNNTTRSVTC